MELSSSKPCCHWFSMLGLGGKQEAWASLTAVGIGGILWKGWSEE